MTGLTIPNTSEAAFADQAAPDGRDFDALVGNVNQTGVVTGCQVTQHSTGAMSVDVASGVIMSQGSGAYVTAVSGLTIASADPTNLRYDLVVSNAAGTPSVITGTAGANPAYPAIPTGYVFLAAVRVAAAASSILTASIVDKRVITTIGPYFDQHAALKDFRAAKGKLASRSMDVLCLGTSLTEGYYASSETTRWVEQLRLGLQANLNPPGAPGGEGYIPAIHGVDPATGASSYGAPAFADRAVITGTTVTKDRTNAQPFGLGKRAVYLSSSDAQAVFTTTVCDRIAVLFTQGTGTGNMSVSIDGGAAVLVPTNNATRVRAGRWWDSGPLTRGTHTVTIRPDNTAAAPGNVYNVVLEGLMLFDGDGAPGPANILTPAQANIDDTYNPVALGNFWNVQSSFQTGCTVARSSAQAYQGTYSLAVTTTAASPCQFYSGYFPVKPRSALTFSVRVRAATVARNWVAALQFFAANTDGSVGATLASFTGTATADTTSGWTTISCNGDVPDTAAWCSICPAMSTTPGSGETHYFDGFDVGLTSYSGAGVVNTGFQNPTDGSTTGQGRGVRVWEGAHASFYAADFAGSSSANTGGSGSLSTNGTWLDALDAVNPDLILMDFGVNENNAGQSAAAFRDTSYTLIQNIKARLTTANCSMVLIAQNPGPTSAWRTTWFAQDGFRDQIRALAAATGCGFTDVGAYFPLTLQPGQLGTGSFPQPDVHDLLFEDGIHYTDAGQSEVAQALLQYLLQGDPRTLVKQPVNNNTATTDPGVSNDITQGYIPGSRWVNTTRKVIWENADGTAGAAVWNRVPTLSMVPTVVPPPSGAKLEPISRAEMAFANTSTAFPGTSTGHAQAVTLQEGATYSSITFVSGGTAATLPTHQWAAILDTSFVVKAVSSDLTSAAWGATAAKTFTFSSTFTPATSGTYYVVLVVTATTQPTMLTTSQSVPASLATIAPAVTATTGTGQAGQPAVGATITLTGASRPYYYVYLS